MNTPVSAGTDAFDFDFKPLEFVPHLNLLTVVKSTSTAGATNVFYLNACFLGDP